MITMEESLKEGTVQVALIENGRTAKPIETSFGDPIFPEDGTMMYEGIKLYTMPKKMAAFMISQKPNRYRLIGKISLDAKVSDNNGGTKWIKIIPWKREKPNFQVGTDPETKKPIYEYKFVWTQLTLEELKNQK